jgi:hypothetical protein
MYVEKSVNQRLAFIAIKRLRGGGFRVRRNK